MSAVFSFIESRNISLRQFQRLLFLAAFFMFNNLIEVGGIRNPIAAGLCVWAIVHDLAIGDKKKLCCICYVAACLFHSFAYVVVVIRMGLLLLNVVNRKSLYIIVILSAIVMAVIGKSPDLLYSVGCSLRFPDHILFTLNKVSEYRSDMSTFPIWQLLMYTFTYIAVWMVARKEIMRHMDDCDLNRLYEFLTLYLVIVFANINVTSLFGRSRMIIYPIFLIFFSYYLEENIGKRIGIVLVRNDEPYCNSVVRTMMSMISIIGIFAFDIYATYLTMDMYFAL